MVHETVRFLTEEQTRLALRFYYAGSEECAPGHSFGPAVRPHYLIHFVSRGKGRYLRGNQVYELEMGDAFLILPGETTRYVADEVEPWNYIWVAFDGSDARNLLIRCGLSEENPIYHSKNPGQAAQLLMQAAVFERSFREAGQNLLAVMGNFYLLFSHMVQEQYGQMLLAAEDNGTAKVSTLQELYYRQAVEYLKSNFGYPVKVEQLAAQIGISRAYLYKVFIAHCGKSMQQYLLELRMDAAKKMLRCSSGSITEIAYSCGFSDSPSFCRQFKKAVGMTPKEYRKQ